VTGRGPQDPTVAYLVHRAALIGIVITVALSTSYLVFRGALDIRQWVITTIQGVRGVWTSWHWSLW
jgi:hypothetical protein